MKLNKILIAMGVVLTCASSASFAADTGTGGTGGTGGTTPAYTGSPTTGEIHFKGELVNSACGLAASSTPVMVDFAQITTSSLKNGAKAGNVKKEIELQNCDTTVARHATVTYTPNSVDVADSSLAAIVSGTASGAGSGLTDNANQPVVWGTAASPVTLSDGKTVIPFTAFLKADSTNAVQPGDFTAQINFKVDY